MRFGIWRGAARLAALALTTAIAIGAIATAPAMVRAGIICHTIPREVTAVDVHTGGPYFAPPIPNGCYAKDPLGTIADGVGMVHGCLSSLTGKLHGCCSGCHGAGCKQCGGTGKCGHCDNCLGSGGGHHGGNPCAVCGGVGKGCGFCGWRGLLHGHDSGQNCGVPGAACGSGLCSPQQVQPCSFNGHASTVCSSMQSAPPLVSAQGSFASPQTGCMQAGCQLKRRHFHRLGKGCSACGGMGCGICQGGAMSSGSLCGGCGGAGCNACGGQGLHGQGKLCSACGGHGCSLCGGTGHLKNLLGASAGLIGKLFHVGDIEYFVGPGGPVPITPGYVPYVVTTRSPRDFLAFPPFSDLDP